MDGWMNRETNSQAEQVSRRENRQNDGYEKQHSQLAMFSESCELCGDAANRDTAPAKQLVTGTSNTKNCG